MIKEFCAENMTDVPRALQAGAKRVELCDNLAVGGTTVSYGVMAATLDYCQQEGVPVMCLIRPRGGDFCYNDVELKSMLTDISVAQQLGADGVVLGCLTPDRHLDVNTLQELLTAAEGLQVTFHMAFDLLSHEEQFAAIDLLADTPVTRILTHGGPSNSDIMQNLPHLQKLINYAKGRLTILPGGGITWQNVEEITAQLSLQEVHGTKIVAF